MLRGNANMKGEESMMKKVLAAGLAAVMVLSMAGCGGKTAGEPRCV